MVTLQLLYYTVIQENDICYNYFTPVVNSRVDNVLVKTAEDLNQLLWQFIDDLNVCLVNTFVNGHPNLRVNHRKVKNPKELRLASFYTAA